MLCDWVTHSQEYHAITKFVKWKSAFCAIKSGPRISTPQSVRGYYTGLFQIHKSRPRVHQYDRPDNHNDAHDLPDGQGLVEEQASEKSGGDRLDRGELRCP